MKNHRWLLILRACVVRTGSLRCEALTFFSFIQKIIWQGTMPLSGYLKCNSGSKAKLVVYSNTCAVTGLSFTTLVMAPRFSDFAFSKLTFLEHSQSSQAVEHTGIHSFSTVGYYADHDLDIS